MSQIQEKIIQSAIGLGHSEKATKEEEENNFKFLWASHNI